MTTNIIKPNNFTIGDLKSLLDYYPSDGLIEIYIPIMPEDGHPYVERRFLSKEEVTFELSKQSLTLGYPRRQKVVLPIMHIGRILAENIVREYNEGEL